MKTSIDGEALKTAIRSAGFTIKSFAQALGVNWRTVYFYIEGRRLPTLSRLMSMAETLKIKPELLIRQG